MRTEADRERHAKMIMRIGELKSLELRPKAVASRRPAQPRQRSQQQQLPQPKDNTLYLKPGEEIPVGFKGVIVKQEFWTAEVPKTTKAKPITVSSDSEVEVMDAEPSSTAAGAADPAVGGASKQEAKEQYGNVKPPEFFKKYEPVPFKGPKKDPYALFAETIKKYPWAGDLDELDETLIWQPKASVCVVKSGDAESRPCWLRLHRKWLAKNFLVHLCGDSNIRYRLNTYASICHHVTTPWDCHPICWQCWLELGLPLCGIDPSIDCYHCSMMGSKARKARNAKLNEVMAAKDPTKKMRRYTNKSGLPGNVYNQEDADYWAEQKGVRESPNPDWLVEGEPPGTCFPYVLIYPGQSIRSAVASNPKWMDTDYAAKCKAHNAELPQDKDVTTPSSLYGALVPRCLTWGCRMKSDEDDMLKGTSIYLKNWSRATTSKETAMANALETNTKLLAALADRLLPLLRAPPTAEATPAPELSVADVLATLTPDDLSELRAQDVGGEAAAALSLSDEAVQKLSHDQLLELVKTCRTRVKEQEVLLEQQKAMPDQRELARAAQPSPSFARQADVTSARQMLREKNLQVEDWTAEKPCVLNPGQFQFHPEKSEITELCDRVHALDLGIGWSTHRERDEEGLMQEHKVPLLEPQFLAHQWEVLSELQDRDPFDIILSVPAEIGMSQGAAPTFSMRQTQLKADVHGKYPKSSDGLLMRYRECDQLNRLSAAAGAFNNMAHVAMRILSLRLEDVSVALDPKRETERLLATLAREASAVTNKLLVRINVLGVAIMRRDGMLRGNKDPTSHPNMFGCPLNWTSNYASSVGSY